ncbi:MAG: amidohydrolase family protein, partial [Methanobrevibacter sp.]|nr:amidohydrolase family protein [Methanobrevibacter sp.]
FPEWDVYGPEKSEKLKEIVKIHQENVASAYQEGVNILMGTDSGVIPHGHNLKELSYLVEIGMSPSEAIACGTSKAAEFLGKDNLGLIESGKIADLILVKGNPLEDINLLSNNDNILAVIQDGKFVKS